MQIAGCNDYEEAFEAWLRENGVEYVAVDQGRRAAERRRKIKTFDYLVYGPRGRDEGAGDEEGNGGAGWDEGCTDSALVMAVELKGRKFAGTSTVKMSGLQCWVGIEDVQGLLRWQERFDGPRLRCKGVIVFAYRFEMPCVETEGREVFEYDGRRYMFCAVDVEDYAANMNVRSNRWRTVMLGANSFRRLEVPLREYLFKGNVRAVQGNV